jgi:hypothetical protein
MITHSLSSLGFGALFVAVLVAVVLVAFTAFGLRLGFARLRYF